MTDQEKIDAVRNSNELLCDICFKPLVLQAQPDPIYGGKVFVHLGTSGCNQHWLFLSDGSTRFLVNRRLFGLNSSLRERRVDAFFSQIHYAKGMLLSGFFTDSQYNRFLNKSDENFRNTDFNTDFLNQFQETYKRLTDDNKPPMHTVKRLRLGLSVFIREFRLKFEKLLSKQKP